MSSPLNMVPFGVLNTPRIGPVDHFNGQQSDEHNKSDYKYAKDENGRQKGDHGANNSDHLSGLLLVTFV